MEGAALRVGAAPAIGVAVATGLDLVVAAGMGLIRVVLLPVRVVVIAIRFAGCVGGVLFLALIIGLAVLVVQAGVVR